MRFDLTFYIKNKVFCQFFGMIFVILLFFSCDKVPKLTNFDSSAWKNDVDGCSGKRALLATILEPQRNELKMIEAPELQKVLGPPNSIEILQRQQRYYIYWIQNPAKCGDSTMPYKELRIRVSALGKVTEVLF